VLDNTLAATILSLFRICDKNKREKGNTMHTIAIVDPKTGEDCVYHTETISGAKQLVDLLMHNFRCKEYDIREVWENFNDLGPTFTIPTGYKIRIEVKLTS
jgi:hypothetical protein